MFRVALFCLAAVISYLVTDRLVNAPPHWKALDLPNERSSHTHPTPRLGGLGVVAAFLLTLPLLWIMLSDGEAVEQAALKLGLALIGYLVVAAVGLIDDLRSLGPLTKYTGQLVAAIVAVWGGVLLTEVTLPFGWQISLGIFSVLVTIIWITGFSNIFNFMDGIDGLAGGCGVIYGLALAVVCFGTGHRVLGAGSLVVAAACLGFLVHNFPPAKIFLGDVGSLFIGYVLAALAVVAASSGEQRVPFIAVLLIFGPFLYDGIFTLLRRLRRGEKLYLPHRSHLYQRLVIVGNSHRRVSLTYYALSLLLGAGGIAYTFLGDGARLVILLLSAAVLSAFTLYVYYVEALVGCAERVSVAEMASR